MTKMTKAEYNRLLDLLEKMDDRVHEDDDINYGEIHYFEKLFCAMMDEIIDYAHKDFPKEERFDYDGI